MEMDLSRFQVTVIVLAFIIGGMGGLVGSSLLRRDEKKDIRVYLLAVAMISGGVAFLIAKWI